jgi:hypothetical protein
MRDRPDFDAVRGSCSRYRHPFGQVICPMDRRGCWPRLAWAVLVKRILAPPVFVWDGCSDRGAVSELDVKRDQPLALAGRAADEVARIEFGVGGELEVAEAVVSADHAVSDRGEIEVLDCPPACGFARRYCPFEPSGRHGADGFGLGCVVRDFAGDDWRR